jgi:hypothetical protein
VSLPIDSQLVRRNGANFILINDADIGGGLRVVADASARDNIPSSMLKVGMQVVVQTPGPARFYELTQLSPLVWTEGLRVVREYANLAAFPAPGTVPGRLAWDVATSALWVSAEGLWQPVGGGGGGGLPPLSGQDGAALRENQPGGFLTFQRLTLDDIDAAFSITSFLPGFTTTKELGDSIVDPSFTAAYNAAVASATLQDNVDTQALLTPFLAFAYGTAPLPARSYVKTGINETVTWTLSATKAPAGPVKQATVIAAWRPRVFYGVAPIPGAYNEAFIEGLASSALASGFARTINYPSPGGTQKLYYIFPTAFGNPSQFKDEDTGFAIPFTKVASAVAVTNAFSVLVAGGYDVWESDNFLAAAVDVVVS